MSKVLLKASLVYLVLGLVGCTAVTGERIKEAVSHKREQQQNGDCQCTVTIVINERD